MRFKVQSLENEFRGLSIVGGFKFRSKLGLITYVLDNFCQYHFGKELVITEVLRTLDMQDKYYKDDPVYQKKTFLSVHMFGRGIDIRSSDFDEVQIQKMLDFVNTAFPYGDGEHDTAIFHNVGQGEHIHLQIRH